MQEYRRRYNLEPLVKEVKREDAVLEQQGRARATVRPRPHRHHGKQDRLGACTWHMPAACVLHAPSICSSR